MRSSFQSSVIVMGEGRQHPLLGIGHLHGGLTLPGSPPHLYLSSLAKLEVGLIYAAEAFYPFCQAGLGGMALIAVLVEIRPKDRQTRDEFTGHSIRRGELNEWDWGLSGDLLDGLRAKL